MGAMSNHIFLTPDTYLKIYQHGFQQCVLIPVSTNSSAISLETYLVTAIILTSSLERLAFHMLSSPPDKHHFYFLL